MEGPRVYLKHKRSGRYFVRKHEDAEGRVEIEWTEDLRKALRMPSEKRAMAMQRRLASANAPCWRVRLLPGVLERRKQDE